MLVFIASCVWQPLLKDVVYNKNVDGDTLLEQTGVHEQSEPIVCIAVYDGDTITVATNEKVRLIGIDAPELSEPGGDISRDFLSCLILKKEVTLVKGDGNTDSYGRLLRYVYVDGVCINEEMDRTGYAEARYIPEVNRELYIAYDFFEYQYHLAKSAIKYFFIMLVYLLNFFSFHNFLLFPLNYIGFDNFYYHIFLLCLY